MQGIQELYKFNLLQCSLYSNSTNNDFSQTSVKCIGYMNDDKMFCMNLTHFVEGVFD